MQRNEPHSENLHANCLIIGNSGILITGASGFGKTSLMLHLIDNAIQDSKFSAMVADDQIILHSANGRLIGTCPKQISGKFEIRGFGIAKQGFVASSIINLVVEIIPPEKLTRLPMESTRIINGISLPEIFVPQHQLKQSCLIITAKMQALS